MEMTEIAATLSDHSARIKHVEEAVSNINELTLSEKSLATNMEHMLAEQKEQGDRLKKLETEPADTWNTVKRTMLTAIIGAIAGGVAVVIIQALASAM